MNNWQPIETAPKNGTRILAIEDEWAEIVRWVGMKWEDIDGREYSPTHWQPLPKPPAA